MEAALLVPKVQNLHRWAKQRWKDYHAISTVSQKLRGAEALLFFLASLTCTQELQPHTTQLPPHTHTRSHLGDVVETQPTIGSNVEEVVHKNIHFQMWDLGGQESLRSAWSCYYEDSQVQGGRAYARAHIHVRIYM